MKKPCAVLMCAALLLCGCVPGCSGRSELPEDAPSYTSAVPDVRSFGAAGDGTTDDTQALIAALQAVQDGGTVYFTAGRYRLSADITVPGTVELLFAPDAMIVIDKKASLTLNGSVRAGDQTVFGGEGYVYGEPQQAVGNPVWFGATGDGVTDDTTAFQSAISVFRQIEIPADRTGYVLSGVRITKGGRIEGRGGQKARLIGKAGTQNMLTIENGHLDIGYLAFDMAAAPEATCLYFNTFGQTIERTRVYSIEATDAFCVIRDSDSTNMVITTSFEDVVCRDGRGTALDLYQMWGFIFYTDVKIDYSASRQKHGIELDFPAVAVRNNAGMIVKGMDITGDPDGSSKAHGVEIRNCAAMWFEQCTMKNLSGRAFSANRGINHGYFTDITCENTGGIYFAGSDSVQILRVTVRDCGIVMRDCTMMQLQDSSVSGHHTGSGVLLQTVTNSAFTGLTTSGNAGYGLEEETGCENNIFVGIHSTQDRDGPYRIAGQGSGYMEG